MSISMLLIRRRDLRIRMFESSGNADGKCGKYAHALQVAARSVNIYADLKVGAM